jgi:hypothetical protein
MKLRIKFGMIDEKVISWYDIVENFPKLINYLSKNYEWVFYDKDTSGASDMILIFSELHSYDPDYTTTCPKWSDLFNNSVTGCQCGADKTSFPFAHMFYCPKWTKW